MENYFYVDQRQQQAGPIAPERFKEVGVSPATLVWRKGLAQWTPAGELEELAAYFRAEPAPRPAQPQAAPAPREQSAKPQPAPVAPQPTAQAAAPVAQREPSEVPNNLWLAVLSVVFMCSPIGIVAIHHAAKVDYYALRGNVAEAIRRSKLARRWSFVALAISFLWFIFLLSTFGAPLLEYLNANYEFVF